MKRKYLAIICFVLILLVIVFVFFLPFSTIRGVEESNSYAVTCMAYSTPDGLPPIVDSYKKFHILKGGLNDYKLFRKKAIAANSLGLCASGSKIIKAELFL